jgi:hypothetical protein
MEYLDFSCKRIAEGYYLVFVHDGNEKNEIGGFTHGEVFIYPAYKYSGFGKVIVDFMKETYGAV